MDMLLRITAMTQRGCNTFKSVKDIVECFPEGRSCSCDRMTNPYTNSDSARYEPIVYDDLESWLVMMHTACKVERDHCNTVIHPKWACSRGSSAKICVEHIKDAARPMTQKERT
jgi:hypothetical protein